MTADLISGASHDGSATNRATESILRAPDAYERHIAVKDARSHTISREAF